MKTFKEFETALLNGDPIQIVDRYGVIFSFYACRRADVCGLVTVCVEVIVVFDEMKKNPIKTTNVVSSMEAYWIYEKFSKLA